MFVGSKLAFHVGQIEVSGALAPGDAMRKEGQNEAYLNVGRSALYAIATVLDARSAYNGGNTPVQRILDYGCGYGRVSRFLRAAFPDAQIDVTDLLAPGVAWCVQNFRCTAVDAQALPDTYDLIWLGSVFTHLNPVAAKNLLHDLKAALRPSGVLTLTSRGRYSASIAKAGVRGLIEEKKETMLRDYERTGYGFAEYDRTPGYGVSTVKQSWYFDAIVDDEFIQIAAMEKGWASNQDVLAYMRHPLGRIGKLPVYT